MDIVYQPHMHREIESLIERIHPPRVCIDNDSSRDCTVIKIDSANRHGILMEMVQVLTDLDLVISKSYISSDGGWIMDVFHVTDQVGNKLTDTGLVNYIQQALCEAKCTKDISTDIDLQTCNSNNLVIEFTAKDHDGLFSEISEVLLGLSLNVTFAIAWTHNHTLACIIHLEDGTQSGPIDPQLLTQAQAQLKNVLKACDDNGEEGKKTLRLRLRSFAAGHNHTERRLHQMMYADGDYMRSLILRNGEKKECEETKVWVGRYEEKGYWVVNVRCMDRPKLLFDTVCALTDMQYKVFHAAVSSNHPMAHQEYFVRPKDGSNLDSEREKQKLSLCLIAAIERRISHGLKVDIRVENTTGILSKVTRVIGENGLSIRKVEIGREGEIGVGSFYVENSSAKVVNPNIAELVRRETGGSVIANYNSPYRVPKSLSISSSSKTMHETMSNSGSTVVGPKTSIGTVLWSQLECLSNHFRPIN